MTDSIHDRLRQIREREGLSYRQWAERIREAGCQVTHGAAQNRERGAAVPADYVRTICETFDVHPVWMLTGRGPVEWEI